MVAQPKDVDPITLALQPPPNETPQERQERLRTEAEAKRVSNLIDEQIKAERVQIKKEANVHKILLLGQAESGKSTTLKNFQMMFTPNAFAAERKRWRPLIQLNLIRSILVILDSLEEPLAGELDVDNYLSLDPSMPNLSYGRQVLRDQNQQLLGTTSKAPVEDFGDIGVMGSRGLANFGESRHNLGPRLTRQHEYLKMRLSPLRGLQEVLVRRLSAEFGDTSSPQHGANQSTWGGEFLIRAKALLGRRDSNSVDTARIYWSRSEEEDNEISNVLHACKEDMIALWQDQTVREILYRRDVRLEEGPGFFLHDIERVATRGFMPTSEDVLRSRIRTMGVQEYRFKLETGSSMDRAWAIYDVGGSRNQRASWIPFFDDCHIIFLAPISCFDQVLAEDRRVNRIEDSLHLWKAINSSKLLSKAQIVLFLNKCDILTMKLKSGVRLKDYVRAYDGPNTTEAVTRFFRHKFRAIQKNNSSTSRTFYCHLTSVTDPDSTHKILISIQDIITRNRLADAVLL